MDLSPKSGLSSLRSEVLLMFNVLRCVTCEVEKDGRDLEWFRLSKATERELMFEETQDD